MYFSKIGEPMGLFEWARLLDDEEYCRVGLDVREGIRVSTVWVGLDMSHSHDPGHIPIIFETMVFDDVNTESGRIDERFPHREYPRDMTQERYATLEEAELGHQRHVRVWLDVMDLLDIDGGDKCLTDGSS